MDSENHNSAEQKRLPLLAIIGPGILVAATGVGTGDLATGAFSGSQLGVAILWAVVIGAALKFVLNEGLARWQLATGHTLLEGTVMHLGKPIQYIFLAYLLFWSFFVGSALMSACGVVAHALIPLGTAVADKIAYGILHSLAAVILVHWGGYRLFEKLMRVCIAIMFATVILTAIAVQPAWSSIFSGLFIPTIPKLDGQGLQWTIALMGGVGGTLTVLCYGYWIREEGRTGIEDLKICRIDLATGYTMTALFGMGMVILGSRIAIDVDAKPATLIVQLAAQLEQDLGSIGPVAKWAFLVGAWGAVFSSLFGVWQSVPYLFADFCNLVQKQSATEQRERIAVETHSWPYRAYLYGIAVVPMVGLKINFASIQKWYAIVGAAFMPMLALVLLVLNGREKWVGRTNRNSIPTSLLLVTTLIVFSWLGWYIVQAKLG